MDVDLKKLKDNKGQAIMEFLAFTPFLLAMLSAYLKVGSAINGSINQQKATRRYYYHLEKGNAFTPGAALMFSDGYINKERVQYFAIGWANELKNNTVPMAPCYEMPKFIGEVDDGKTCDDPVTGPEPKTKFIKPYTVYGTCGTSFVKNGQTFAVNWNSAAAGNCDLSD